MAAKLAPTTPLIRSPKQQQEDERGSGAELLEQPRSSVGIRVAGSGAMGQQLQRPASVGSAMVKGSTASASPQRSRSLRQRQIDDDTQSNVQSKQPSTQASTIGSSSRPRKAALLARPQSALAGSAPSSSGANRPQNSELAAQEMQTLENRQQQQQQRNPTTKTSSNTLAPKSGGSKTTRVRINSTSEQIEDPNWLIRMSQELEQSQQQKRSHLKALHRKLKSTIAGGNSSQQQLQELAGASPTSFSSSSMLQAPLPAKTPSSLQTTPVKVPISILKQRNNSPAAAGSASHLPPSASAPGDGASAGQAKARSAAGQARKSAGRRQSPTMAQQQQQSCQQQPNAAESPHLFAAGSMSGGRKQQTSVEATSLSAAGEPTVSVQTRSPSQPAALKAVPICADGQVKVSGWKRNNLLAKTLSHFDEIRGNPRPIFVPTKIRVATSEPLAAPPGCSSSNQSARAPSAPGSGGGSTNKFAEIVREAISKKGLLLGQAMSLQNQQQQVKADRSSISEHSSPSSAPLSLGSFGSKRSSDGEMKRPLQATSDADSAPSYFRPASAGPARELENQHQNHYYNYNRSNSALASSSPNATNSIANNKQQQVIVSLNRRHVGVAGSGHLSSLASPQLVSQLLSVNAQQTLDISNHHQSLNATSARQFKLEHKNQQLLQNLRRQSNELQAILNLSHTNDHADHQTGNISGSAHSAGSGHLKDWKRLTSKLALLTSGRIQTAKGHHHLHTHQQQHLSSRAAGLLAVNDDSGAQSGGQLPLRLTVSNQESGSAANQPETGIGLAQRQRASSSQQQLLARLSGGSLGASLQVPKLVGRRAAEVGDRSERGSAADDGQGRKLSSSSMVVQPVTGRDDELAGSGRKQCHSSAGGSPLLSSNELLPGAQRRRSDSGAYQGSQATGERLEEPTKGGDRQQQRAPIVVNRNDLIQLLQVTIGSNSPMSANDGWASSGSSSSRKQRSADEQGSGDVMEAYGGDCAPFRSARNRRSLQLFSSPSSGVNQRDVDANSGNGNRKNNQLSPMVRSSSLKSVELLCSAHISALEGDDDDGPSGGGPLALAAPPEAALTSGGHPEDLERGARLAGERQQAQSGGAAQCMAAQCNSDRPSAALKRPDLSWVVKRTSKVAFFHQKLRKMRWHSRQQQQQQRQKLDGSSDQASGGAKMMEASKEQAAAPKTQQDAGGSQSGNGESGADVFMDPTLIGDAIEIFLRSTMQRQQQRPDGDGNGGQLQQGEPELESNQLAEATSMATD